MKYNKKSLYDIDLGSEPVLVRVDFNVPIKDGKVTNDKRIIEALPTLEYLLDRNCKIILLSHLGRVKSLDDIKSGKKSLKPVFENLKEKLPGVEIAFEPNNTNKDLKEKIKKMHAGSILLLENTRYNDVDAKGQVVKHESKNDPKLGTFWASLANVFVNDAFGTAHRSHASNVGIASKVKNSCVGFLVEKELDMLSKAIDNPLHPFVAIFGGAKISDKIASIENIANIADYILIGGAMTYTFWKALGKNIGNSLIEEESVPIAKELLKKYGNKIILPVDSLCATAFENQEPKHFKGDVPDGYMALDIGKKTIKVFNKIIKKAKTIVWNGPMGAFELPNFEYGTKELCQKLAKSCVRNNAFCVIGGGDSAAAAINLGYENAFSHISTGGGASLAYFEGSDLPGISSIKDKA